MPDHRPTRKDLEAAAGKKIPDIIAPGLKVLFCGINPGLYSAAIGHHFGRPGNRFWPAIFAAGITPRLLSPYEDCSLPEYGYGITNVVERATAAAEELTRAEFIAGGKALVGKVHRYAPRFLAVLGLMAYRAAFDHPNAQVGPQSETIGDTRLWVLPNPSGLNAHYRLADLADLFRQIKEESEK